MNQTDDVKVGILKKLQSFSFNKQHPVSLQIKLQLQKIIIIPKHTRKQVSFHLHSPVRKKVIRIKSPDCRLSLPSTKSSEKTSNSLHNHEISYVSEFLIPNHKDQLNIRAQTLDWLIKIVSKLGLGRKVLYNTVYFLQSYLKQGKNQNNNARATAMVILFLICKLQYQDHIQIQECLQKLEYQISREQFIQMEIKIFSKLQFKIIPLTLYDRLIYHLQEISSYNKHSKFEVKLADFLLPQNFKQYLTVCKRLDIILLSNINKDYSLDSIIYALLHCAYTKYYKPKELRQFERLYESYWKNKYLHIESYRLKALNSVLESIQFNIDLEEQSKGLNHWDRISKQTYCPELKLFARQIYNGGYIQGDSIIY